MVASIEASTGRAAVVIEQVSAFDGQRPLGVRDVGIHDEVIAEVVAVADVGAEIR